MSKIYSIRSVHAEEIILFLSRKSSTAIAVDVTKSDTRRLFYSEAIRLSDDFSPWRLPIHFVVFMFKAVSVFGWNYAGACDCVVKQTSISWTRVKNFSFESEIHRRTLCVYTMIRERCWAEKMIIKSVVWSPDYVLFFSLSRSIYFPIGNSKNTRSGKNYRRIQSNVFEVTSRSCVLF